MEELATFWYQEGVDELKQKLLYTTVELETAKIEAAQENKRYNEYTKQLLNLLKFMQQERDEARDQLQNMLQKKQQIPPSTDFLLTNNIQQQQPPVIQLKSNSSTTESNSFSHGGGSSPVESFYVNSPDLSIFVQELTNADDPIIDNLVEKNLPEKGKLLQAVMDAGPLLQTLLLAGPLPQWRNPPPPQGFKIPPVFIKSCETVKSHILEDDLNREMGLTCVTPMLNFSCCPSNENVVRGFGGDSFRTEIPVGKRQRLY